MSAPSTDRVLGGGTAAYLRAAEALLERLLEQNEAALADAADRLFAAVRVGRLIHVAGSGHSTLFALEAFFRAGGLACINPIWHPALLPLAGPRVATLTERTPGLGAELAAAAGLAQDDVLVVFSQSGINPVPIELAQAGHAVGATVVAVVSLIHSRAVPSRQPAGLRLDEVADIVINTGVPLGDAAYVARPELTPVAPFSSLAGIFVWNTLLVQVADRAAAAGVQLPVWHSANEPGGDDHAAELAKRYRDRIPGL